MIKTLIVDEEPAPVIIDGKSIAEEIRLGLSKEVLRMKATIDKVPGLAVVLVGQRRDSQAYVRNKTKACEEVGMRSLMAEFPEDCGEEDVLDVVSDFNRDPSVHGVLVQLPLPKVIPIAKFNTRELRNLVASVTFFEMVAALGRRKNFGRCKSGKGCRWLPSAEHGEPRFKWQGAAVHPLCCKSLCRVAAPPGRPAEGQTCGSNWKKQCSWTAYFLAVAGIITI